MSMDSVKMLMCLSGRTKDVLKGCLNLKKLGVDLLFW